MRIVFHKVEFNIKGTPEKHNFCHSLEKGNPEFKAKNKLWKKNLLVYQSFLNCMLQSRFSVI